MGWFKRAVRGVSRGASGIAGGRAKKRKRAKREKRKVSAAANQAAAELGAAANAAQATVALPESARPPISRIGYSPTGAHNVRPGFALPWAPSQSPFARTNGILTPQPSAVGIMRSKRKGAKLNPAEYGARNFANPATRVHPIPIEWARHLAKWHQRTKAVQSQQKAGFAFLFGRKS